MRMSVTVLSALLATSALFPPGLTSAALAHDGDHPIAGETEPETEGLTDQLWDLLLPQADAAATIGVQGNYRTIRANGYPNKAPGQFPNRNNPHSISKKNYSLKVPLNPTKRGRATSASGTPFGIALNGVLFDPATAEFWQNNRRSEWNYEALGGACKLGLDRYNAHVQPDGTYHYHSIPTGLLAASGGRNTPALIGYAADGFPIYGPYGYADPQSVSGLKKLKPSYRIKSGTRSGGPGGRYNGKFTQDWAYVAGSGDLDQCNGRFAVTPEFPNGTYHYVLTDSFPFIPRCWMGSPDSSFARLKSRGGQRRGDVDTGADLQFASYGIDDATVMISGDAEDGSFTLAQAEPRRPRFLLFGQRPLPPDAGRGPGQGPPRGSGAGPRGGWSPGSGS